VERGFVEASISAERSDQSGAAALEVRKGRHQGKVYTSGDCE
jgi:hypothetical protein